MRTDQSIINRYTVTAGVLSYSVTFPLYEQSDVQVMLSTDGGATERELALGDDYSVTINDGQTGGTVTLKNGVASAGNIIAFISNVPYTQELDLSNVATLDVGAVEEQLDRSTQQIQQVAEKATRHLTVPATSPKTPQQVMTEIFDTVATANEYAVQAEKTYQEVQKTAAQVAQDKASVDVSLASINVSEANVTRLAGQVAEYTDELELVAENMDGIQTVDRNQDAIAALAADLQGFPIYEFDGGWIGDPVQPMNGVGGVLRIVAENIDIIKQVAGSLENSEALLTLADDVAEIGSTDYTGIDQSGEA
jgi:hypothetical protein